MAGYTDKNDPHSPGQIDPSELMFRKSIKLLLGRGLKKRIFESWLTTVFM